MPKATKSTQELPHKTIEDSTISGAERVKLAKAMAELDELEFGDEDELDKSSGEVKGRSQKLREIASTKRDEIVQDAKRNGWKAQAMDQIDAHRAGDGRLKHNANMRERYRDKVQDEEEREVRGYGPSTLEKRREQNRIAKAKSWAAATTKHMTTDEMEAKRRYERERKQRYRQKKKDEAELQEVVNMFDEGKLVL